jgi:pimeloyl-ACP methyl ester carboxylesterase
MDSRGRAGGREENRWADPSTSDGRVANADVANRNKPRAPAVRRASHSAGAPDLTIAAIAVLLLPLASPLQSLPAPLDTLVDVGGYHLHMVVYRGTRPLTIVMESGGGAGLAAWSGVEAKLAERTGATVVAYDRAGFGESGMGPADLTPRQQVRQLHEALERLGTAPDRIVVGHSYGGLLALMHAHLYPERVRGLVLWRAIRPRATPAWRCPSWSLPWGNLGGRRRTSTARGATATRPWSTPRRTGASSWRTDRTTTSLRSARRRSCRRCCR